MWRFKANISSWRSFPCLHLFCFHFMYLYHFCHGAVNYGHTNLPRIQCPVTWLQWSKTSLEISLSLFLLWNYVTYTYLFHIHDSCRLFAAMSHFMTFESTVQNQNRFAWVCECKLKENLFYKAKLNHYTKLTFLQLYVKVQSQYF